MFFIQEVYVLVTDGIKWSRWDLVGLAELLEADIMMIVFFKQNTGQVLIINVTNSPGGELGCYTDQVDKN